MGCRLGKRCLAFHPKMFVSSLRKKKCFDESCDLFHTKGTKRRSNKMEKSPVSKEIKETNETISNNPTKKTQNQDNSKN